MPTEFQRKEMRDRIRVVLTKLMDQYTQVELSAKTGIVQSTISNYLSPRRDVNPTTDFLERLAEATKTPIDEFIAYIYGRRESIEPGNPSPEEYLAELPVERRLEILRWLSANVQAELAEALAAKRSIDKKRDR